MTDRELLELAAKAIGMHVLREGEEWPREKEGWFFNQVSGSPPALYDRADLLGRWSPLDDDGDALRLAVKLRIHISLYRRDGVAAWIINGETTKFEEDSADPYADTRRAIVRAAAEIGKSL